MNGAKEQHLVRLINAYGPRNLSSIARRLGVSRETVARSFARLKELGFDIRPNIRMESIGLQRYVALVTPGRSADAGKLEQLFAPMGDYGYLEHYENLAPSKAYLLYFACPPALSAELVEFLSKLGKAFSAGVVGPTKLSWMRYHPMRAPWDPVPATRLTSGPLAYVPADGAPVNDGPVVYVVLLLVGAIQAYPDASIPVMSRALSSWADSGFEEIRFMSQLSSSAWGEHYKNAMDKIENFPMGVARGPPGTAARRHAWASFTFLWEGLSDEGIKQAAMASTSIPFLRSDAASRGQGIYFSIAAAPTHLVPGYISFMTRNAPERMRVAVLSRFANYSVPFAAFDRTEGRWAWRQERLESQLATLRER